MQTFDAERFVRAQAHIYDLALKSLEQGHIPSKWVAPHFPPRAVLPPQFRDEFALASAEEARAFLAHPLLGQRYRELVSKIVPLLIRSPTQVFGEDGAYTLNSSLALFSGVSDDPAIDTILHVWFDHRSILQT